MNYWSRVVKWLLINYWEFKTRRTWQGVDLHCLHRFCHCGNLSGMSKPWEAWGFKKTNTTVVFCAPLNPNDFDASGNFVELVPKLEKKRCVAPNKTLFTKSMLLFRWPKRFFLPWRKIVGSWPAFQFMRQACVPYAFVLSKMSIMTFTTGMGTKSQVF